MGSPSLLQSPVGGAKSDSTTSRRSRKRKRQEQGEMLLNKLNKHKVVSSALLAAVDLRL